MSSSCPFNKSVVMESRVAASKPAAVTDIAAFDIFEKNSNLRFKKTDVDDLKNTIIYALENFDLLNINARKNISKYIKIFSIKNTALEYHIKYSKTK